MTLVQTDLKTQASRSNFTRHPETQSTLYKARLQNGLSRSLFGGGHSDQ